MKNQEIIEIVEYLNFCRGVKILFTIHLRDDENGRIIQIYVDENTYKILAYKHKLEPYQDDE